VEKEGLPVHRHAIRGKRQSTRISPRLTFVERWPRAAGVIEGRLRSDPESRVVAAAACTLLAVDWDEFRRSSRPSVRPASGGEITSIAVLPLKTSRATPRRTILQTDDRALITELGKISTLQVISHQTVLGYRQTAKPLPRIARDLNVNALLEGTVLRSEGKVRITVNVVQAVPERHLWPRAMSSTSRTSSPRRARLPEVWPAKYASD